MGRRPPVARIRAVARRRRVGAGIGRRLCGRDMVFVFEVVLEWMGRVAASPAAPRILNY